MFVPKPTPKRRKEINITQGAPSGGGWKKGYQSFVTDSRTPLDALNDLTNATLDQDNLPRPRPSLILFGSQPLGTVLGVGTFIKIVSGVPEKWDISMQVIAGVGKVHTRKDGGTWVAATGTNSYSSTAQVNFCQSGDRVYVSNAVNAMSYFNNATGAMVVYTALGTPSAPSAVQTGLGTANFTYYYRVSGNNNVGESIASVAGTVTVTKVRDQWVVATPEYVTVTWSALAGATSYNIYVSTTAGEEEYLTSVSSTLTFRDDGTLTTNTFKRAPSGNSTAGPILKTMWNKDGQLYGVGDIANLDYLWYDGGAAGLGDFSPFNGGGNVGINSGGDTTPQAVRSFRTGKGDSAVTVLSRGVAGSGKMHHVVFTTTTFDGNVITIPNVQEANGQAGTVSADAVVEADNSLYYPTGQDFKSTGTSANVQNILSTRSVSNDIIPDVQRLNLSAMANSKGQVFENKIYWALPVGSTSNNQIWIKDLSRRGIWIMPWVVSAQFMWLSENNTTGTIDFCIYNGTSIMTFTRAVAHQDNGVAFRSRVAHEGMVWSDSGMTMAAIQEQRFKLLQPSGTIQINSFGLDEDGAVNTLASDTFSQTASFTGWGQMRWSEPEMPSAWSSDVGTIDFTSTQIHVTTLEIDETVNQLGWEVIGEVVDTDYLLSTTHTNGIEVPKLFFGD
jgi:hypothetical protein